MKDAISNEKQSFNEILVAISLNVIILLVCGGFVIWKISTGFSTLERKSEENDGLFNIVSTNNNVDVSALTFDNNKIINPEANGWQYLELPSSANNIGLTLSVNSINNTGTIQINWDKFHNYSTRFIQNNIQGAPSIGNVQIISVKKFIGQVQSAFLGSFGQSFGRETAFFVMLDGSVEYVPIQKLYDICGYRNNATVNSFGEVPGVFEVLKVVRAKGNAPQSVGSVTTLGIKADGSFYDFQFNLDVNSLAA